MAAPGGHIAVVGGGSAGWLAALMLHKAYGSAGVRLSVVESPDIPTVGVGEGSTSLFRQVMLDLGIDEDDFLRNTGATVKFGIHHRNWTASGTDYFGPIDDPNQLVPPPPGATGSWLHTARAGSGAAIEDMHLFTHLMRRRKAPFARKPDGRPLAVSPFHHAYHFDQARLGRFLAGKARGIEHVEAEVRGIERDPDSGLITALELPDAPALPVDFVLDCTGFSRAIISRMGGTWKSCARDLPLTRAMPFWLDHAEGAEIAPCTTAHALSAGWMWAIPTVATRRAEGRRAYLDAVAASGSGGGG